MNTRSQAGFTLVELIVSIVIVSIAAATLLGVLSMTTRGSADAVVRHQAVAIANAYLEEASLKSFADPDGATETSRAEFDDINDYHGLDDAVARDQFGNALTGLDAYRVQMSVGSGTLGSLPSAAVRLITVTVRHSTGLVLTLSAYRTCAMDGVAPC